MYGYACHSDLFRCSVHDQHLKRIVFLRYSIHSISSICSFYAPIYNSYGNSTYGLRCTESCMLGECDRRCESVWLKGVTDWLCVTECGIWWSVTFGTSREGDEARLGHGELRTQRSQTHTQHGLWHRKTYCGRTSWLCFDATIWLLAV